ncbi:hypothetical protein PSDVSF_19520 [Pseudodesulfovibrio sediminis]|uniref:Uncharacterized protein n=1 Tax=Pseudodesulfovibrio sediminis TaxID=2810563 RepID=A0ABM7P6X2_9BACT|nr:hypothetical protein PSDVSF_19520 [Pseudodesulfovibrio sediminis]
MQAMMSGSISIESVHPGRDPGNGFPLSTWATLRYGMGTVEKYLFWSTDNEYTQGIPVRRRGCFLQEAGQA